MTSAREAWWEALVPVKDLLEALYIYTLEHPALPALAAGILVALLLSTLLCACFRRPRKKGEVPWLQKVW